MNENVLPTLTSDDISIIEDYNYKDIEYYFIQFKTIRQVTKEQAEKIKQDMLESIEKYPKLKESYLERVATANKIISGKIDEIKTLKEELERPINVVHNENLKLKAEIDFLKNVGFNKTISKLQEENHNLELTNSTLKTENEDLQGKLDGDAMTYMNLQQEILNLKLKIKHHIEIRAGETVYAVWRRELMELIE